MIKNRIVIEGDTAKIRIIQRNGREHTFLLDSEILNLLAPWSTAGVMNLKGKFYVVLRKARAGGKQIKCYLHLLIMDAPSDLFVDHINGDTLDNRKENLRLATPQQNGENRSGENKNSTSGVRGVCWYSQAEKWKARAQVKGENHLLGFFNNIEEAEKAVVAFRRKHMPFSEMDKEVSNG